MLTLFLLKDIRALKNVKKIVFLDEKEEILNDIDSDDIILFVGTKESFPNKKNIPYFHRNQIDEITLFIMNFLRINILSFMA